MDLEKIQKKASLFGIKSMFQALILERIENRNKNGIRNFLIEKDNTMRKKKATKSKQFNSIST